MNGLTIGLKNQEKDDIMNLQTNYSDLGIDKLKVVRDYIYDRLENDWKAKDPWMRFK